jgi:hypothetical protein
MRKLILSILTLWGAIATAAADAMVAFAQDGDVTFNVAAPTAIEAGVSFRVEFSVSSLKAEFTPPDFGDFEVQAGPIESRGADLSITPSGVTRTQGTTISYVLVSRSAGVHTISAASVVVDEKSYSTKPLSIEVVDGGSGGAGVSAGSGSGSGSAGQGGEPQIADEDIFVVATVNRTDVYKGEPVVLTFKVYRRAAIDLGEIKLPTFNGFWYQDITPTEPVFQRETYNNRVYETVAFKEYLLYPQQSGTLSIEPLEATARALIQTQSSSSRDIFDEIMGMGMGAPAVEVKKKIASGAVQIAVNEWPAGAPENFDGAVGQFRLEATPPPSAMEANSSGTYTMRLSGTGNFPLIRAPKLTLPQSFEQYNVTSADNTRNTRGGTSGYREFSYPFIPRSDGLYTIQPLEFSYFDPQARRYETLSYRETSIEVVADSTAVASLGGGLVSGISSEELQVFGEDIRFIKRGEARLRPKGQVFMFSPLYISLVGLFAVMFVVGLIVLPRYVRNMQSDRFVRGKRANKVALRRFRVAEISMSRDDRHGFYDEMLKALWGYMSDKFDIPTADLTKDRIREELFERSIPEAQGNEYVRIISECEEAQYSPVVASRMGEIYREGIALVSELESASRNAGAGGGGGIRTAGGFKATKAMKATRKINNDAKIG